MFRNFTGKSLTSGGLTAISGQASRILIQLLATAMLARLLTPSDFGLVAMSAAVIGFSALFTELGLGAVTIQRSEFDQQVTSTLLLIQVFIGCVFALILVTTAPIVALGFGDHRVELLIFALAPTIPLNAAGMQHMAILQRDRAWLKFEGIGTVSMVSANIGAVILAWCSDLGYWALVAQAWISAILTCSLAWWLSDWKPGPFSKLSVARPSIRFGTAMMGYNLVHGIHRQLDNILIGAVWGPAQLGLYSRAYGLLEFPRTAIARPFSVAVFPVLSQLKENPKEWRQTFLSSMTTVICVTGAMTGLLFLHAETLIRIIFGEQWLGAVPIFQILAVSMLIHPVYNSSSWIPFSLGRGSAMFKLAIISTSIYCISFLIGVQYGAIGVAFAFTTALIVLTPFRLWWVTRDTSISQIDIWLGAGPPIFAAIVTVAIVSMLSWGNGMIYDLISVGAFLTIYVTLLFIFWISSEKWKVHLQPATRRISTILIAARDNARR